MFNLTMYIFAVILISKIKVIGHNKIGQMTLGLSYCRIFNKALNKAPIKRSFSQWNGLNCYL